MKFQNKVSMWLVQCFGFQIANDIKERNYRFFEEATELVQSKGMTKEECLKLIDYTYGRPVGEPSQEVGGVRITLAALCYASSINEDQCAQHELDRIQKPDIMEAIRLKQQMKPRFLS